MGRRVPTERALLAADGDTDTIITDGNDLVIGETKGVVRVWDVGTGRPLVALDGRHGRWARAVAFSPDGRTLVTAGDARVLLWDLVGVAALRRPAAELSAADLERLWAAVQGEDAIAANAAVWELAAAPRDAVPFLRRRLTPAEAPAGATPLARLIADLDSDAFADREKASAELTRRGRAALPALRKALEEDPSLEARRRLEKLVRGLEQTEPSAEEWRARRAVRVLEHAGTAEAKKLLEELGGGSAEAPRTQEAKAALERLKRSNTFAR